MAYRCQLKVSRSHLEHRNLEYVTSELHNLVAVVQRETHIVIRRDMLPEEVVLDLVVLFLRPGRPHENLIERNAVLFQPQNRSLTRHLITPRHDDNLVPGIT